MPPQVCSDPLRNDATVVLDNAGARAAHDRIKRRETVLSQTPHNPVGSVPAVSCPGREGLAAGMQNLGPVDVDMTSPLSAGCNTRNLLVQLDDVIVRSARTRPVDRPAGGR